MENKREKPNKNFIVENECGLLEFLISKFQNKSRNAVKTILSSRCVSINGKISTKFDFSLKSGDKISVSQPKQTKVILPKGLEIIFEDENLIAINKPAGLLAVSTDRETATTAYHLVRAYVESRNQKGRIFVVHRLDRDTSGIMIFAKNENVKQILMENWNELVLERGYTALVSGKMEKQSGRVRSYLMETQTHMMYSTDNRKLGKEAITDYKVISRNDNYSLVEISIKTGRKNQIRVHMSDLGHPIVGDKMYGLADGRAIDNPLRRLGLHANRLRFINPLTKQEVVLETKLPKGFISLSKTDE